MSLRVISHSPPTGMYMTVKIGSKNRGDLEGLPAHDFAKKACMELGFSARGLSNTPMIYPVNANGEDTAAVAVGQEPIGWFESEYRFTTGI